MGRITGAMKRLVEEQKIGYVASISPDGTPNLSPKATMVVLDDDHIMFGEIRSPNTVRNVARNAVVEMNFVDTFSRKGYRFKGPARLVARGDGEFARLLPRFAAWGDLCDRFNGIVVVKVERAAPLISPAYDAGATEDELRAHWGAYFRALNEQSELSGVG